MSMPHGKAANAQVGLSYAFLTGFFAVLILEGLGYIKISVSNNLREVLMLVMSFWFMRQRVTADPVVTSEPEKPPVPKVS